MSDTFKLVQEAIAKLGYKVLEDDGETITVFYQLNVIHIIPDGEDGCFATAFAPVDEKVSIENRGEVLEKCNKLTSQVKSMKFCIFEDDVLASSEFYYRNQSEAKFQVKTALNQLAAAKALYNHNKNITN